MKHVRALEDYVIFFEKLNRRSVKLIDKHVAPGVRFKDPFNDVHGADAMRYVLEHMFTQLHQPKFKVHDVAWGREEHVAYLKWTFKYTWPKTGAKDSFEGMSQVTFGPKGKIVEHIDFWDPTHPIYMRVPFLKWMMAKVLEKLKV